ncbi:ATP synthase I chain [Halobacteroides halobius DSM 5150]|uniref:ATP synthase I chain n=1 Tax=Halobacteroides halobius (strain ATCC 35273 / DSM 5150 / MD-1) TaxID=748449 RepID=L0KCS7_HALHC|nr:ATP synthase subunit I [Halobacteroides halobius]AGB42340.1 ATP synthase I chain [Halobacteroides halobius DSM 5150]
MMKQLTTTKRFIFKWASILNLLLIFLVAFFFGQRATLGLIVGAIMSLINFHLLSFSLQKAVKFEPVKAGIYTFIQYIIRYSLWFAVLYISLQRPDINLVTVIVGMLTVKIVVLIVNVFNFWPEDQKLNNLIRKEGK